MELRCHSPACYSLGHSSKKGIMKKYPTNDHYGNRQYKITISDKKGLLDFDWVKSEIVFCIFNKL